MRPAFCTEGRASRQWQHRFSRTKGSQQNAPERAETLEATKASTSSPKISCLICRMVDWWWAAPERVLFLMGADRLSMTYVALDPARNSATCHWKTDITLRGGWFCGCCGVWVQLRWVRCCCWVYLLGGGSWVWLLWWMVAVWLLWGVILMLVLPHSCAFAFTHKHCCAPAHEVAQSR